MFLGTGTFSGRHFWAKKHFPESLSENRNIFRDISGPRNIFQKIFLERGIVPGRHSLAKKHVPENVSEIGMFREK
jgi:hypothetical protein